MLARRRALRRRAVAVPGDHEAGQPRVRRVGELTVDRRVERLVVETVGALRHVEEAIARKTCVARPRARARGEVGGRRRVGGAADVRAAEVVAPVAARAPAPPRVVVRPSLHGDVRRRRRPELFADARIDGVRIDGASRQQEDEPGGDTSDFLHGRARSNRRTAPGRRAITESRRRSPRAATDGVRSLRSSRAVPTSIATSLEAQGAIGIVDVSGISLRNMRVLAPPRRRYQSLGSL